MPCAMRSAPGCGVQVHAPHNWASGGGCARTYRRRTRSVAVICGQAVKEQLFLQSLAVEPKPRCDRDLDKVQG
eukprot:9466785-Pyramimonas_sp.AAC.2